MNDAIGLKCIYVTQGREDEGMAGTLTIAKSEKKVAQVLDERRSMASFVERYHYAVRFG